MPEEPVRPGSTQRPDTDPLGVLTIAMSLHVDSCAAEVTDQLLARGIGSVLLKGPSFADWLYRNGPARPYSDVDLLVSPADWWRARGVLMDLGYSSGNSSLDHPQMGSITSEGWIRGVDQVDLHCTLWGLGAPPERVWEVLSNMTESMRVGGRELAILRAPARALHLALHAAQHGDPEWRTARDLERGLRVLDPRIWSEAAQLADQLQALPAFASGLKLVESGNPVAHRLGLEGLVSADATLRATGTPLAWGFEHLRQTQGGRGKLRVLQEEMFPSASFMRWWSPLARRGTVGLVAAYVWRLIWLARHAPIGFVEWRAARRAELIAARSHGDLRDGAGRAS